MSPSAEDSHPIRPDSLSGGRLLYLFTTFPVLTETFLQREVRALREAKMDLEIHSIWGGDTTFEGLPIQRFHLRGLFRLAFELPYWLLKRPRKLTAVLRALRLGAPANFQNFQENILGLAYGILIARKVTRYPPTWIHAAWATMPATAALTIQALTGRPFSSGAHAYDIFQDGGDWILREKIRQASFLHVSTNAARDRLIQLGAHPDKVLFLRRGLLPVPKQRPFKPLNPKEPLRLLTVGRLVPKKDLPLFLEILATLKAFGIPCTGEIIGDGPLHRALLDRTNALGLDPNTILLGKKSPAFVEQSMRSADFFLFTGKPAPDGDRDGLPNVIPEAMAVGLPVIAADQPGVREAISDGHTGFRIASRSPETWVESILTLRNAPETLEPIINAARSWVEIHFDARKQTQALLDRINRALQDPPPA